MTSSTNRVFLDAGAFIALIAEKDQHHDRAVSIYHRLVEDKVTLITTNHIVDETCTWLLRDPTLGHRVALQFGNFIQELSTPVSVNEAFETTRNKLLLLYVNPEIEYDAWKIFKKYDTTGFTFTDCTSFAVMSMLSIRDAFSFDVHFDIMGFQRL